MNKFNKGQLKNWDDAIEGNEFASLTEEELAQIAGAGRVILHCHTKCLFNFCVRICKKYVVG